MSKALSKTKKKGKINKKRKEGRKKRVKRKKMTKGGGRKGKEGTKKSEVEKKRKERRKIPKTNRTNLSTLLDHSSQKEKEGPRSETGKGHPVRPKMVNTDFWVFSIGFE